MYTLFNYNNYGFQLFFSGSLGYIILQGRVLAAEMIISNNQVFYAVNPELTVSVS